MFSELFNAIEEDDTRTVSSLIKKGVTVNHLPSPLFRAAERGCVEIIAMLLDAGAEINAGTHLHESACHAAIKGRHVDALKLLVDRGATLDGSHLKAAAEFAMDDTIILFLLDAGAPLDDISTEFWMMSLVAKPSRPSVAVLKRLLARNVDFCAIRDSYNRKLCHYVAFHALSDGNVDGLLRAMVDAGISVDDVDDVGATPLHFAVNKSSARILVELGADIDRQNKMARSALHLASRKAGGSCVELLLALGANVRLVDTNGQTASHLAASEQHRSNLSACLAAGGALDQPDYDGNTVRTIATRFGFQLPTSGEIDDCRRRIAKARLDLVRRRASQICIGLQALNLSALELCEIMMVSFGALGSLISFHQWWAIATTVKHIHDRKLE